MCSLQKASEHCDAVCNIVQSRSWRLYRMPCGTVANDIWLSPSPSPIVDQRRLRRPDNDHSGAVQDRVMPLVRGDGRIVSVRRQMSVCTRNFRAAIGWSSSSLQDGTLSNVSHAWLLRVRSALSLHSQRRRDSACCCRQQAGAKKLWGTGTCAPSTSNNFIMSSL